MSFEIFEPGVRVIGHNRFETFEPRPKSEGHLIIVMKLSKLTPHVASADAACIVLVHKGVLRQNAPVFPSCDREITQSLSP